MSIAIHFKQQRVITLNKGLVLDISTGIYIHVAYWILPTPYKYTIKLKLVVAGFTNPFILNFHDKSVSD